jgi:hypothetical protein
MEAAATKTPTKKYASEISAILASKQNNVAKLMDIAELLNGKLYDIDDQRFNYIAQLFEGSILADKLRKTNVDQAIKGIKQAIEDYKQGNAYFVQYAFTAHYRSPEMFTDMTEVSDVHTHPDPAPGKIHMEANMWLQSLPKQKNFKIANKHDVSCQLKGARIQVNLIDSHGKLIDGLGQSKLQRKF